MFAPASGDATQPAPVAPMNRPNRLIEDNLFAGGGYTVYAGAGSKGATSNIVIRNNRVATMYFPKGVLRPRNRIREERAVPAIPIERQR